MGLAKGLDYTLPSCKLKKGGYLINYEVLFNRLSGSYFFGTNDDKLCFKNPLRDITFSSLYNFNNIRKRLSNIPNKEMRALKVLSKNKDIVIQKPDKGSGIVILNFKDYVSKIEEIVKDQTKFKVHKNQDLYKISRSIENKVRTYLRDNVKKPGYITQEQYRNIYPKGSYINDVRKRGGRGVKQKQTPADMGEGGRAKLDVHIWLKFDKYLISNLSGTSEIWQAAAINSYNSSRLSQLRKQYSMSAAVY